jgi:hypothetical protein
MTFLQQRVYATLCANRLEALAYHDFQYLAIGLLKELEGTNEHHSVAKTICETEEKMYKCSNFKPYEDEDHIPSDSIFHYHIINFNF